ncbi:hypothetical protein [Desulforhabdus amnigena]|jgi:hypothetical protein|uniref:Uncharacterized protein n=1 Tax=Desulforhabdus amnigena TaxID=40218 RepID=A0A9W6FWK9_9BACT|nr:hypothetical protein [Desulforhabdus amnigena]NLJ29488.1 hypothetical protein [Deltaproteobacteria bacterium]GLI36172.1 hypothetical protein DAMNIGENAA_36050 [Desulforhabdus amnigena]
MKKRGASREICGAMLDHFSITQLPQLANNQKGNHHSQRLPGPSLSFAVKTGQPLNDLLPRNDPAHDHQLV